MTEQIPNRRKGLATTLGIAIAAALSPSGKIISSAVAGAVAVSVTGYAIHEHKPPPHQIHASVAAQGTLAYLADAGPLPLVYTDIESEGHEIHVLLTTGADARGSHGSAPSLWVSGWPIGGVDNPNQSFQRVGPTFGEPAPHSNAPDSPSPQQGFRPETVSPPFHPPIPEKFPCSKENKLLGLCEVDSKDEASAADDETVKDASNPSTHPNSEAAGPDNVGGQHLPFNAPPDVETGTPSAQDHPQPNVALLEKLLTEEFNDVTPPGKSGSTIPEETGGTEGNPGEQQAAEQTPPQTLSFSTLALIPASVPEPSLISLMLLGVAAMAWTGRRRSAPPKQTRV